MAFVIVSPEPAGGKVLDLFQRFKQVLRKPVVAYGVVIALDVGVLVRLSRLDKRNLDAMLLCPLRRDAVYLLRAVIAACRSRLTMPLNDLVLRPHNAFRWQREVHVDSQSFSVVIVDHVEQSDTGEASRSNGPTEEAHALLHGPLNFFASVWLPN